MVKNHTKIASQHLQDHPKQSEPLKQIPDLKKLTQDSITIGSQRIMIREVGTLKSIYFLTEKAINISPRRAYIIPS